MDSKFLNWLLGIRNDTLNRYMIAITHLGTGGAIWLFTVFILFYLGFRIESINIILALIFNGIVCNIFLKNTLKRKRPSWISKVELLIKNPTDFSFPSGHASSSFAAALTIYFYFKGMGIVFIVIAILIAFSRIYHFVHYPSDVIIGAIIGMIIAFLTKNYYDKFILDFLQNNLEFLFRPLPKIWEKIGNEACTFLFHDSILITDIVISYEFFYFLMGNNSTKPLISCTKI